MNTSFLSERKKIIKEKFNNLKEEEFDELAKKTRGLRIDDIVKVVTEYIETGKISYQISHPTNTCDPYNGNWEEKLIDIKQLKTTIKELGFDVNISNSIYGYSNNKVLNLPKYFLNLLIKMMGSRGLTFSPAYTLEISKSMT